MPDQMLKQMKGSCNGDETATTMAGHRAARNEKAAINEVEIVHVVRAATQIEHRCARVSAEMTNALRQIRAPRTTSNLRMHYFLIF
jgi:hypothetical protein